MSTMTTCVTDTSVIPFPTIGSTYTHTSNTAASPLPHIPFRGTCAPLLSLSDTSLSDSSTPPTSDSVDYPLQSRSATYVRHDSESSSSSTPSDEIRPTIIPRSKRTPLRYAHSAATDSRDVFAPIMPASTPIKPLTDGRLFAGLESQKQTPLRDPSDDEDTLRPFTVLRPSPLCKVGKLRLEGSIAKEPSHSSNTTATCPAPAAGTPNVKQHSQTIRKKSGQPVKSSLKSTRRPELHVVTDGSFAKSEPATPTHTKAVHFDSKLEHVKLFLAEQKPLAVSRDGSPTSDTSGDEFPSFIYGNGSRENQQVKMLLPNMPSSPRKSDSVALQELVLSQDQRTITGYVRVRNIAYEKWLAARFTLDWWQTTSEVTARYEKSIEGCAYDVFSFAIRLSDIWSRIGDKTIFVALRYNVAGQEFWDNNAGQNYHIKFVLARASEPSSAVDNETSLRDLNTRLEDLAKARSIPAPITPYRLGRSFSADYQYSSFAKSSSSRYDFAQAYRTEWAKKALPQPNRHTRTHTYPSDLPVRASPSVALRSNTSKANEVQEAPPARPEPSITSLESPGEATPTPSARSETMLTLPKSSSPSRLQDSRERNHRRGFLDKPMEGSPTLRRTPTGSPLKFDVTSKDNVAHLPRIHSYPFAGPKPSLSIQTTPMNEVRSEEPTPYEAEQTSSSSASSLVSPLFSPVPNSSENEASYKQFLDQFCFFTGAGPSLQESPEALPSSHSTSRKQYYMLSHSPPPSFSSARDSPPRFPFDVGTTVPTAVHV